jgi:hypothetical protein
MAKLNEKLKQFNIHFTYSVFKMRSNSFEVVQTCYKIIWHFLCYRAESFEFSVEIFSPHGRVHPTSPNSVMCNWLQVDWFWFYSVRARHSYSTAKASSQNGVRWKDYDLIFFVFVLSSDFFQANQEITFLWHCTINNSASKHAFPNF